LIRGDGARILGLLPQRITQLSFEPLGLRSLLNLGLVSLRCLRCPSVSDAPQAERPRFSRDISANRNRMISSLIWKVSCVVQVVWIIPEELIKRVSYAQFPFTICLLGGLVNYRQESIHSLTNRDARLDFALNTAIFGDAII
jgi:hypothetical protein